MPLVPELPDGWRWGKCEGLYCSFIRDGFECGKFGGLLLLTAHKDEVEEAFSVAFENAKSSYVRQRAFRRFGGNWDKYNEWLESPAYRLEYRGL